MPFRLHCSAFGQEVAGRRSAFKILNAWTPSRPSIHTLSTDFAFHSFTVVALNQIKYHSKCTTTNYFKIKIRKNLLGRPPQIHPPLGRGHSPDPTPLAAFGRSIFAPSALNPPFSNRLNPQIPSSLDKFLQSTPLRPRISIGERDRSCAHNVIST